MVCSGRTRGGERTDSGTEGGRSDDLTRFRIQGDSDESVSGQGVGPLVGNHCPDLVLLFCQILKASKGPYKTIQDQRLTGRDPPLDCPDPHTRRPTSTQTRDVSSVVDPTLRGRTFSRRRAHVRFRCVILTTSSRLF